jgi:hypothetical protein
MHEVRASGLNDPIARKSAVIAIAHCAKKVARQQDMCAGLGQSCPFDMAVAAPATDPGNAT